MKLVNKFRETLEPGFVVSKVVELYHVVYVVPLCVLNKENYVSV